MDRVSRKDLIKALPAVALITFGIVAAACMLTAIGLTYFGFHDAHAHLTLAVIVPTILTPVAAFPLVIVSQRLQLMKSELEGLLLVDGLTDIPNRRAFFERAEVVFSNDSLATAMMIDIDHFKSINDRYGHEVGDIVLSAVGHMIVQTVSNCQTGGVRIAARLGGEEFGVLVEDIDAEGAADLAARIVEHVGATPVIAAGHAISVTVSIGVAQRCIGGAADELMRAADGACYRAKRLGRNQWCPAPACAERVEPEPGRAEMVA